MHAGHKEIQNLLKLMIILGAVILVVLILTNKSNSSSSKSSSSVTTSQSETSTPHAVLPPATVAPKVSECSQSVSYNSSGVPSPLQCTNGDLNTTAWEALSAQEPKVMSLGYNPSPTAVQSAVCSDINAAASDSTAGADNAIETGVFQISALYYGWNFGSNIGTYIASC